VTLQALFQLEFLYNTNEQNCGVKLHPERERKRARHAL
jgi:hypothetical protein